jgi:hypothetical protein
MPSVLKFLRRVLHYSGHINLYPVSMLDMKSILSVLLSVHLLCQLGKLIESGVFQQFNFYRSILNKLLIFGVFSMLPNEVS